MASASQNFVSPSALATVHDLRRQFVRSLSSLGFVPADADADGAAPALNVCTGNKAVVRATIFAGLYPNVARMQHPRTGTE